MFSLFSVCFINLIKIMSLETFKSIEITDKYKLLITTFIYRFRKVTADWAVQDKRLNCGAILIVIKTYRYVLLTMVRAWRTKTFEAIFYQCGILWNTTWRVRYLYQMRFCKMVNKQKKLFMFLQVWFLRKISFALPYLCEWQLSTFSVS